MENRSEEGRCMNVSAAGFGVFALASLVVAAVTIEGHSNAQEREAAAEAVVSAAAEAATRDIGKIEGGLGELCTGALRIYLPGAERGDTTRHRAADELADEPNQPCGGDNAARAALSAMREAVQAEESAADDLATAISAEDTAGDDTELERYTKVILGGGLIMALTFEAAAGGLIVGSSIARRCDERHYTPEPNKRGMRHSPAKHAIGKQAGARKTYPRNGK